MSGPARRFQRNATRSFQQTHAKTINVSIRDEQDRYWLEHNDAAEAMLRVFGIEVRPFIRRLRDTP